MKTYGYTYRMEFGARRCTMTTTRQPDKAAVIRRDLQLRLATFWKNTSGLRMIHDDSAKRKHAENSKLKT